MQLSPTIAAPDTTPTVAASDPFITTSRAARELSVSEATIRRMERSGALPAIRTTTRVRLFRFSDVVVARDRRRGGGHEAA
jgi:excisionase family DNA binding protein